MNILKNEKNQVSVETIKIEFNELVLRSIHFKYKDNKEFTLRNFNQELKNKSLVGIKGKNGSGKSTLLKIILDL